ncbi:substrate-binding domain-containing protein [Streptomyces litchfieldiae]|uniref:Substrate-binding domain-containing protein n=1 Tax=Streptomyces litchfieldiae TaxID=3075543 RepID=A0ABU2MWI5_9ACTN|nr:substrate-binding domain-containing protein [Streptomyces sp. DSM 44938]MDT0344919.1 substrate-binding domain-containing protein [Streptomyces sp. DSM 44938]
MRRAWGIGLAVLLLGGVVVAVLLGRDEGTGTATVQGIVGSEKSAFFTDPEVVAALAGRGFTVRTDPAGSWAMDDAELADYDFAFPGSQGPAEEIQAARETAGPVARPFYSPLVVLAHRSAADVLAAEGLVTLEADHRGLLDMNAYLAAVEDGRTWQELDGAAAHTELTGALYISSTNPLTSNSGALYLAAASFVANGGAVVQDAAAVEATAPLMRTLIQVQGTQPPSSDAPFSDFVSGIGNPLVLVYESQIAALLADGRDPGDVVVLYPDTTVSSDHTLVPLTEEGRELGELLATDPELRRLTVRHGFRPQGTTAEFTEAAEPHAAFLKDDLAGVRQAPAPTTDVLLDMAARARQ